MSQSCYRPVAAGFPKISSAPRRRLLSLVVAHALSVPLATQAATIEVTSPADNGTGCTLREAVATINAGNDQTNGCVNSGAAYGTNDAIDFGVGVAGQTITLGGTQIELTADVQINEGGNLTTIDANNNSRIFFIDTTGITASIDQLVLTGANAGSNYGGAIYVADAATLTVKNSTLTANTAQEGGGLAGFNGATITVQNSTVSGNSATFGGGLEVYYSDAKLVVTDSIVTGNTVSLNGGGIFSGSQATLEVSNSTISSNTANNVAAGIQTSYSTVSITNSTISGNSADTSGGINALSSTVTLTNTTVSGNMANVAGGIGVFSSATLTLQNSTVSGNTAYTAGGIASYGPMLTLESSTISNNSAAEGGAVLVNTGSGTLSMVNSTISGNTIDVEYGAGLILRNGATGNIFNSTITGNTVDADGAGLLVYFSATANLVNTIIANTSYGGNSHPDCNDFDGGGFIGTVNADVDSIIESDSCGASTMNALNVDPDFQPLADNGGPTQTHALNAASPAINAGDNTNCGTGTDLETDQRGEPRDDDECDIGAYEVQPELDLDFGDAPNGSYPTLLASDGARHKSVGLVLGSERDTETDGLQSAAADGDDSDGAPDDEDGVTFDDPSAGFSTSLTVTVSATGRLDAWIDYNADGDWDDAGEQIFTDQSVNSGANVFNITAPVDASAGTTFGRFRVSAEGGLAPTGIAESGEVEDYQITVIDEDTDNDGMTDAYEELYPDELDPNDPEDADDDDDGDGLDSLAEFNADTDPGDPDSDGDGVGDAFDAEPNSSGNNCNNGDDTVVSSLTVLNGNTEQCAAELSIEIQSGVTIESGGRLELIAPVVTFSDGFSVPSGAELSVESADPTPP